MQPHSAAAELVEAVAAVGAVEKLTALAIGAHNPSQMTAVRSRLIQKALHAAIVAARYALPPPPIVRPVEVDAPQPEPAKPDLRTMAAARKDFEIEFLAQQLHIFNGNTAALARSLGRNRSALSRKLKGLGIVAERDPAKPVFTRRTKKGTT